MPKSSNNSDQLHPLKHATERKILPVDEVPLDNERSQETLSSALSLVLENVRQQLGNKLP